MNDLCLLSELYWEAMHKVLPGTTNDQARLNFALDAMNVRWNATTSGNLVTTEWHGKGRNGFKVTVLPSMVVCRSGSCSTNRKNIYYVWHKGGDQSAAGKRSGLGEFWHLRHNWEYVSRRSAAVTGQQWLRQIARP